MAKIIPVSFKENHRDINLYIQVMSKNDKSGFIKDAIEFFINYKNGGGEEMKKITPQKIAPRRIIEEAPDDNISSELLDILDI